MQTKQAALLESKAAAYFKSQKKDDTNETNETNEPASVSLNYSRETKLEQENISGCSSSKLTCKKVIVINDQVLKNVKIQQTNNCCNSETKQTSKSSRKDKKINFNIDNNINYWDYQQTGIKSRPIKLLKHPIENIERKIIITYLVGFLFKLIAIATGPIIITLAYLLIVPSILIRRLSWFLLNIKCLFNSKIRTMNDNRYNNCEFDWNYCPFTYLETFWFKKKLVNNVILIINNDDGKSVFSLEKFRDLIKECILIKPLYRKFHSKVVSVGVPFYKGHYWNYLELIDEIEDDEFQNNYKNQNNSCEREEEEEEFSITSFNSEFNSKNDEQQKPQDICILMPEDDKVETKKRKENNKFHLSDHIYIDDNFIKNNKNINRSSIRRHAHKLMDISLNMLRPLWEIRVIPTNNNRTYLIFRCHQSLADGHSLSKILTDHLVLNKTNYFDDDNKNNLTTPISIDCDDGNDNEHININYDDENCLRPIKEKNSFIYRISKSDSLKSSILVAPLTILLWFIWSFTRRKFNHLNKLVLVEKKKNLPKEIKNHFNDHEELQEQFLSDYNEKYHHRRFYMTNYDLTKFYQIKQMTRSTVSDVILCALSGALREYLRKFNGVSNPPNLNVSLTVNMRQQEDEKMKFFEAHEQQQHEKDISRDVRVINQSNDHHQNYYHHYYYYQEEPQVNSTLVNVPLPTSIEGTVPRLWELRTTMDELRTSADPWVMLNLKKFLFQLFPTNIYQWIINYITLRNSSIFVSNIRGPNNMVESWCVDLLQRAVYEAQQPPQRFKSPSPSIDNDNDNNKPKLRGKNSSSSSLYQLKLINNLGSISGIYYCMQPPTSNIPISFNCITYHNKLFVTSLSRSLLVEDSKLLIRLFFGQLNQLANTIAKRKSFITITRTPIPIEINCQPASPVLENKTIVVDIETRIEEEENSEKIISQNFNKVQESSLIINNENVKESRVLNVTSSNPIENIRDNEKRFVKNVKSTPIPIPSQRFHHGRSFMKDDIETNIGRGAKCFKCNQTVCVCQRRKSLFNINTNQNSSNLLGLLHPMAFYGPIMRTNSNSSNQQKLISECLCGQQLLEELDEELDNNEYQKAHTASSSVENNIDKEVSSIGSKTPSDDGGRLQRLSARSSCAKCRYISMRSTLSLNDEQQQLHNNNNNSNHKYWTSKIYQNQPQQNSSNLSLSSSGENNNDNNRQHNSAYLIVPYNNEDRTNIISGINSKGHSKSETDLLPKNKIQHKRGSAKRIANNNNNKDSWFVIGRKSYHKKIPYIFQKSSTNSSNSYKTSINQTSPASSHLSRGRNLIESSLDLINNHIPSKRRQSVATTTGTYTNIHRSIVVKDEINADVNLRYQFESPFLGRRFSTINSSVVGNQRRSSLIPFGLISGQSFPKLLWDDGETHL